MAKKDVNGSCDVVIMMMMGHNRITAILVVKTIPSKDKQPGVSFSYYWTSG